MQLGPGCLFSYLKHIYSSDQIFPCDKENSSIPFLKQPVQLPAQCGSLSHGTSQGFWWPGHSFTPLCHRAPPAHHSHGQLLTKPAHPWMAEIQLLCSIQLLPSEIPVSHQAGFCSLHHGLELENVEVLEQFQFSFRDSAGHKDFLIFLLFYSRRLYWVPQTSQLTSENFNDPISHTSTLLSVSSSSSGQSRAASLVDFLPKQTALFC